MVSYLDGRSFRTEYGYGDTLKFVESKTKKLKTTCGITDKKIQNIIVRVRKLDKAFKHEKLNEAQTKLKFINLLLKYVGLHNIMCLGI